METTLGSEREQHVTEVKKLKALLGEKVQKMFFEVVVSVFLAYSRPAEKYSSRWHTCIQQDLNMMQDAILEELQREITERPTTKQVEDLRKQVKILQVRLHIFLPEFSLPIS